MATCTSWSGGVDYDGGRWVESSSRGCGWVEAMGGKGGRPGGRKKGAATEAEWQLSTATGQGSCKASRHMVARNATQPDTLDVSGMQPRTAPLNCNEQCRAETQNRCVNSVRMRLSALTTLLTTQQR